MTDRRALGLTLQLAKAGPVAFRLLVTDAIDATAGRFYQRHGLAERLGGCAATVYRLCERGELPHVRVVNSIGVRPEDLTVFLEGANGRA
jgi:hypothetical protein